MSTNPTPETTKEIKVEAKQNHAAPEPKPRMPAGVVVSLPSHSDEERFEWTVNNEDVLLAEQRTTAVYVNRWGQAVIRQERNWDEESDPFMTIDHAHLPVVIARLQEIANAPLDRDEPEPGQAAGGLR
ncbi:MULTISPECIES: hypothetical protein [Bradyrhizobium]|uniref:hypothetical protein n=1 Tax=Bradyrhizobium TaxID=374 RepID=UPI0004B17987|nr:MULTISPECIES: hypothetical protein [Bradyrhizobium]MCA1375699.1 hypothetical protein [Bradyrhizobium sp. IC4060]MCA1485841.1 hypothetical protein [Bradyrhizobium sp. IC4061]